MARWLEVQIETAPPAVEAVANILMEAGSSGVAIADGDAVVVKGYLAAGEEDEGADQVDFRLAAIGRQVGALPALGLDAGPARVRAAWVDEEDWAHAWKRYYKPLRVGSRLLVVPSWERASVTDGRLVIELDPGMAFGTGQHPTTLLCLEALERWLEPGTAVADIGTGSGILAVAAARLGAGRVAAVDIDPVAAAAAVDNVGRNGVADRVRVAAGSVSRAAALLGEAPGPPVRGKADLVVANIIAEAIAGLAGELAGLVSPGGVLVASGIVGERVHEVLDALAAAGFAVVEERESGEWRCVVARRLPAGTPEEAGRA